MLTVGAIVIGSVHVLAVAAWLGAEFFRFAVLRPASAGVDPQVMGKLQMNIGPRISAAVWVAVAIIVLTGVVRAAGTGAFAPDILFETTYGAILLVKIALVMVMIGIGIATTRAALGVKKLADSGAGPEPIRVAAARTDSLALTNSIFGVVTVFLAVGLRVVGFEQP